jgi:hypothetical protein
MSLAGVLSRAPTLQVKLSNDSFDCLTRLKVLIRWLFFQIILYSHRMTTKMLVTFVLLAIVCAARGDRGDIPSLPGWDGPLPSKQYSGLMVREKSVRFLCSVAHSN